MSTAAQPIETKQPEELKLELPSGEVFKGATWEEIAKKVADAQQNTKTAWQTEKQQREALAAQVEELKPKPAPPTGAVDYTPYWELVNTGKMIEAQNWLDAKRFGMESPDQVVPTFTGAVQKTNQLYDRVEIETFKINNPDFPTTEEAADALMSKVKEWGVPWDNRTLTAAYKTLAAEGKVKPVETKEPEKQPFSGPPPGATSIGDRSQETLPDDVQKFANMTLAEQEAELRRRGLMR